MDRRQLLKAAGVGIAGTTAGCSLIASDDDQPTEEETPTPTPTRTTASGPASFENVSLSVPEEVVVESEFTATVTARNLGGEPGALTDTLRFAGESSDLSEPVESESTAPGETVEVEVGPLSFAAADEYELELAEAGATATVTAGPQTGAVGESMAVSEALQVTVEDVSFRRSVFHRTSHSAGFGSRVEEVDAFAVPSEHVLAVVAVDVENTGTETASAPADTLGVRDGKWYGNGGPGDVVGAPGDRFRDGEIPSIKPSESTRGYYLAQVPVETASGVVEITAQIDSAGTLPERVWTVSPEDGDERSFPSFDVSVDAPSATDVGRDYEFTVSVTNEGDAAGTFRAVAQHSDDGGWAQLRDATSAADLDVDRSTGGVVERELGAGESAEIALTNFGSYVRQYAFRLAPAGIEWETQYEPADLTYGDTLKSGRNANVTVRDIRTAEELTVYDDWNEETTTATPDDEDNQYVAIRVRYAERDREDSGTTPESSDFHLRADGTTVGDSTYVDGEIRESWYSAPSGEIDEQSEVTGWLLKEVPKEYSASDLSVEYVNTYSIVSDVTTEATWRHE